ncbi:MAG: lipid II flippase MurJ, partial [Chitinophagaceae bacterium]
MNLISRLKTESFARGMWLSVVFNILAKGILFLLTILLAAYFGSNIKTDIYFFVYGSMVLLAGFINAIDHAVLIPQSMRLRQSDGDVAAMTFLNYFLRIYIFIGVAFVLLMYFFGTRIFGWLSKFSEADIELYRNYFLLGSCYFFFLLLTNYINAILSSLKYFTVPMIISGVNSCVVIAGILLLHNQLDVLSVFISGIA